MHRLSNNDRWFTDIKCPTFSTNRRKVHSVTSCVRSCLLHFAASSYWLRFDIDRLSYRVPSLLIDSRRFKVDRWDSISKEWVRSIILMFALPSLNKTTKTHRITRWLLDLDRKELTEWESGQKVSYSHFNPVPVVDWAFSCSIDMFLAEDRILCFELVAKANEKWVRFRFLMLLTAIRTNRSMMRSGAWICQACSRRDVSCLMISLRAALTLECCQWCSWIRCGVDWTTTSMVEWCLILSCTLLKNLWLIPFGDTGSFAAGVYALYHFGRLYKSNHGLIRLFFLHIQALFNIINLVMSWFGECCLHRFTIDRETSAHIGVSTAVANFFLTFDSTSSIDDLVDDCQLLNVLISSYHFDRRHLVPKSLEDQRERYR